ncbi:MAG: Assimilatory ferredoxin--nitrate reductase 1, partial [Verrucomicrobiales bacterium]|nr:Assimilatory ferredoxin--nitrate reductase 1 [Verrucomicrobiales bacterium]
MQPRIDMNLGIQGEPDRWVHSACILCSNGCGLDIAVKDGRIVGVRGDARH